nr:helix-turn-helix domain-containing protein [Micromonospora sp. DSM 115978]
MTEQQTQPRTQAERSAQARRRLVDAAIRLLAEHGYTGTTLTEIGRVAGVSRGLVTHHFGSKDACVVAAIEQIRDAARQTFTASARGDLRGLARLDHLVEAYLSSVRSDRQYTRALYVVLADAISEAPSLREAVAHTDEVFRAHLC